MMRPPFTLTAKVLQLCTDIARLLGQYEGLHLTKPEPKLRRSNRIRTIQASLAIEGNTLALDQVTAILTGRRVVGSKREILEVENAIRAYDQISLFQPYSEKSLLKAHAVLMSGLVADAGKWRQSNVGVFQGKKVAHAAPQAKRVPELMKQLFTFVRSERKTNPLILSAVVHYELEFIHPFSDGNGRIGRLWQTILLTHYHPIFEFTPIETVVRERQAEYYKYLGLADREGDATPFVEFSLSTIFDALETLKSEIRPQPLVAGDRLAIARQKFGRDFFSRKDYMLVFKSISTATASRDLAFAVAAKSARRFGEKSLARYRFN